MVKLIRTDSTNLDFHLLVKFLDKDLAQKNGDKNDFFQQFNQLDFIQNVVLLYVEDGAVACGAYKKLDHTTVEIKRMYTLPEARKKGYAQQILNELMQWATEEQYTNAVLETGQKMKEAIRLYKAFGFEIIPNYPPYEKEETSRCFRITLINGK